MNLNINKIVNGPFEHNAYIISYSGNECIIIDPGLDYTKIKNVLNKTEKNPIAILLTHAHLDHIGITNELQKEYQLPVYLHQLDLSLSNKLNEYCRYFNITEKNSPKITNIINNDKKLKISNFNITTIHTPGHTEGGLCYLIDDNIFVGDTIFKNSIGRTDLPGGNYNQLINSIKNKIFRLNGNINIYSGHGEKTYIEYEKSNNIFLSNE